MEYDLEIVAVRKIGAGDFAVRLICAGRTVRIAFRGIKMAKKKNIHVSLPGFEDHVKYEGTPFTSSAPARFLFSVRKDHLKVTVNNRVYLDWENPPFGAPGKIKMTLKSGSLVLNNFGSRFEISKLTLKSVSGEAPRKTSVR